MKYIFVGYNPVVEGSASSGRERLLLYLCNLGYEKRLNVLYICSKKYGKSSEFIVDLGWCFKIIEFIYFRISRVFKIKYYVNRHINEIVFDIFVLLKFLFIRNIHFIITTNPWLTITSKYVKSRGVKVILLAGNPSDNMIFQRLTKEKERIGFFSMDAFDYYPRLRRYNQFAINTTAVISINEFTHYSYSEDPYFKNAKIYSYKLVQVVSGSFIKNIEPLAASNNSKVKLLYIAHTTLLKGLHLLIDSFLVLKLKCDIELTVAGDIQKELMDFLKIRYDDQLSEISFIGHVNTSQKVKLIIESDVLIIPSLIDMSPVVVFEGMSCSKLVIVSKYCGNSYLIDNGKNGFIFDPYDPFELVSVLEKLLETPDKIQKIGKKGYETYTQQLLRNDLEINKIFSIISSKLI